MNNDLIEPELSHSIVGAFFDSYYKLGYGFLESIYCGGLCRELIRRRHAIQREVRFDVTYDDGYCLGRFRIDLLVETRVIIEVKTGETLPPFARRQVLNYLRATNLQLGILLHYGPKPQFYRLVSTAPFSRL